MDIKPGQVYRHNRRRNETMRIIEKDDMFINGWNVRWSDGSSGICMGHQFKDDYSLDEQWVVGEILNKYGQNG